MARSLPKAEILIVWQHEQVLETRLLLPGDDVWTVGESLLGQYLHATHVRWYHLVNGLTRPVHWQSVHDTEQGIGTEKTER